MRRQLAAAIGFLLTVSTAMAFFEPLTTEQRVAVAKIIAVIEVAEVDYEKGVAKAKVIQGLLGAKADQKIKVWEDIEIDKDGKIQGVSGRDPYLEKGKRYFIYLNRRKDGKLVTVQSSLDCLDVKDGKVEREDGEGFEPLKTKIAKIKKLIAKRKTAAQYSGK